MREKPGIPGRPEAKDDERRGGEGRRRRRRRRRRRKDDGSMIERREREGLIGRLYGKCETGAWLRSVSACTQQLSSLQTD